jgi:hypothetical protein
MLADQREQHIMSYWENLSFSFFSSLHVFFIFTAQYILFSGLLVTMDKLNRLIDFIYFPEVIVSREGRMNYLCTYDLYSPVHNVLDACISITWGSGSGLGPGIPEFFGPCEMGTSQ